MEVETWILGGQLDRLRIHLHGFVVVVGQCQDHALAVIRLGIVGVQLQRFLIIFQRPVKLLEAAEGVPAVPPGGSQSRLQMQHFGVIGNSLVIVADVVVRIPVGFQGLHVVRLQLQRLGEERNGGVALVRLHQADALLQKLLRRIGSEGGGDEENQEQQQEQNLAELHAGAS